MKAYWTLDECMYETYLSEVKNMVLWKFFRIFTDLENRMLTARREICWAAGCVCAS